MGEIGVNVSEHKKFIHQSFLKYNGDCVWGEIMQLDWPDCNLTMMVMMLNVNDDDVDKDKEEEKEGRLAKLLS